MSGVFNFPVLTDLIRDKMYPLPLDLISFTAPCLPAPDEYT